jgi:hypothetical protein
MFSIRILKKIQFDQPNLLLVAFSSQSSRVQVEQKNTKNSQKVQSNLFITSLKIGLAKVINVKENVFSQEWYCRRNEFLKNYAIFIGLAHGHVGTLICHLYYTNLKYLGHHD